MTDDAKDQRPRPRKQPRQSRARHTVEAIIEATARILEESGHEGFNTNAIAGLAGVSIGTLYQYFPDKNALLGSLIGRETSRLVIETEAAAAESDGVKALNGVILAAVRHQMDRPRLARLLDFEEARLPFDPETRSVRARYANILFEILGRADLPAHPDLAIATNDIVAIIRGLVDASGERGEANENALVERVQRAVLGYLRT